MLYVCDLYMTQVISCLMIGIFLHNLSTQEEHQRIRTFAIFQKFLTLKIVWWSMEKFIF